MLSWMKNKHGRHSAQTVLPRSTSYDDYKYGFSSQVFPVPVISPVNHDYEEISGVKGCDLAYAVTSLSDMFEIIDYLPCLAPSNKKMDQDEEGETASTGYQPVAMPAPVRGETKAESNPRVAARRKGMKRVRRLSRKIARWSVRRIASTSGKTSSRDVDITSSLRRHVALTSRRVCKKLKMAGSKVRLSCFEACHDISRVSEVSGEEVFTSDEEEETKQTTKLPAPSISSSSDVSSGFCDDDHCDSDSSSGRSRSRKSSTSSESDLCIENPLYDENEGRELYVFEPRTGFGLNRWYRHH